MFSLRYGQLLQHGFHKRSALVQGSKVWSKYLGFFSAMLAHGAQVNSNQDGRGCGALKICWTQNPFGIAMVPGFIDDPKIVCVDKCHFSPFLTVIFQTWYVLLREIPVCVCKISTSCTLNKKLTFSDCPVLALVFS